MFSTLQKLPHAQAEAIAWQFLLAASRLPDGYQLPVYLSLDEKTGLVSVTDVPLATSCLHRTQTDGWCCSSTIPASFQTLFDLYLPILSHREFDAFVVAHLGQSIDSAIATASGDALYVTGEQNRKHLHCLRALSDAVIVGAGTAIADDPQLTTRAVPGDNPVRVIIDPHARVPSELGICNDKQARTVLIHQSSVDVSKLQMQFGPVVHDSTGKSYPQVERWLVPDSDSGLSVDAILALLTENNLNRLFVEGGGITVSRFLEAGCLDRLHVAVAPVIVGKGTQALQVAGAEKMMDALRPPCAIYRMGDDVLWDFDVSALSVEENALKSEAEDLASVERIR